MVTPSSPPTSETSPPSSREGAEHTAQSKHAPSTHPTLSANASRAPADPTAAGMSLPEINLGSAVKLKDGGHDAGTVKVVVKLSSSEAGALEAKVASGELPAGVVVHAGADPGTVTLSGHAAAVKAVLTEIYFAPNPEYQRDLSIRVETHHDLVKTYREIQLRYDDTTGSYHAQYRDVHPNGFSVSDSIHPVPVASELIRQELSQTQAFAPLAHTQSFTPPAASLLGDASPVARVSVASGDTPLLAPAGPGVSPSASSAPPLSPLMPSAPLPSPVFIFGQVPLAVVTGGGVSTPPVLSGFTPAAYTENGAAFVLDTDVTVTDTDSPALKDGILTVGYALASHSGDALSLKSDALGAGAIRLNGTAVEYSATGAAWQQVGSVTTDGSAGQKLVIALNAAASPSVAEKIFEHVTYTSTDDNPPATKDITFELSDGAGGVSAQKTLTVTITGVNDAPVVANAIADQAAAVSGAFSFQFASNAFTDPEGTSLTYTATKSDNTALPGWLSFDPSTRTFSGTPGLGDIGTVSVKVTGSDGALSANDTFDIVVSNNLAASNLTRTESYTEDTTFNLTDIVAAGASANVTAKLTLSNTAAGSLTTGTSNAVTSTYNAGTGVWTATGAKADVNALLSSVSFVPTLNYNGNFTIATHVDDTLTTLTGTLTMNGVAVNDAPTVAGAIPEQGTNTTLALNYTLPAVGTTFGDVEGHAVSYGSFEYWDGSAWTTTLPANFTYTPGTLTLSVAVGAAVGAYSFRIAGVDNGTPNATGYATFVVGVSSAALYGTPAADTINGTASAEVIIGLASNDSIYGNNGDDTLFGGDGNDTVYGEAAGGGSLGNDVIYGGAGSDNLYGDSVNDATGGRDTLYGGSGGDGLYGYANDDVLYGEDNNDALYGGAGNDILDAGLGNDYLYGEAGADTLTGGAGNDNFVMFAPNTDSTNTNTDVITDFTQGQDKLQPTGYVSLQAAQAGAGASTATMLTWQQSGGNTYVYGSGGTFTLKLNGLINLTSSDFVFATHNGTMNADTISGSSGIDLMYGNEGDDSLSGSSGGNDFIWGGDGNDTIYGGWGIKAATLTGDAGSDVFVFRHTRDGYSTGVSTITDFVHGTDKIYMMNIPVNGIQGAESEGKMGYSYNVGTNTTTIAWNGGSTEQFSIKLTGNITLDNNDFVFHNIDATALGTNTIRGGYDPDGMVGSTGNDEIYTYGYEYFGTENQFWGDQVFAGAGNDFVRVTGIGYIEQIRLGDGDDTLVGESFNWGWGGNGNNVMIINNPSAISNYGGGGNNSDTMIGGLGADNFSGNSGNDLLIGNLGVDGLNGGANFDTIFGGVGADNLNGFNDDDTIIGGADNDTITLGTGNDQVWYFYTSESTNGTEDKITDFSSSGADKIFLHGATGATAFAQIDYSTTTVISTVTYTIVKFTGASGLDANFKILLQGDYTSSLTAANFIFGNATYTLNPAGENYTGNSGTATAGADHIVGSGVADTISGNGGMDIIYGGGGGDLITGGPAAGDTFGDELWGEAGNDTVQGGSWHDTIYGGDNDDVLRGGDGYDWIDGGNDNDTIYGENDIDTLNGGVGNDSLYGGNGIDFLDGGTGVDKLFGEAGNDFFMYDSGDLGNDGVADLTGGADVDTLRSVNGTALDATMLDGSDIVGIERFELSNTNNVVMTFAATYDDGAGVDSIYGGVIEVDGTPITNTGRSMNIDGSLLDAKVWFVGGYGADTLKGGTGNDYLGGGTGNDILTGNNGNDTLGGGLGVDTLTGGAGNDIFAYTYRTESTTTNSDVIADFTNGQDRFSLSGLDFYNKTFADLTVALVGGNTTITLNNTTFMITLTGDHTAELDASDFLFS